jgi:dTDP-6-deoxy-L-talose 4-dehydrogenase (NAD+)
MKFLVTGATGGLARLVIQDLLKHGHEVIGTARSIEKAEKLEFFNQITFIPYDIYSQSKADLYTFFGKPDSVIHLAWEKLDDYNNSLHLTTILECHKSFIFNLVSNGLKDFNGIGTCYEYGLREGELDESMEAQPILPYSQAKNALREYIEFVQKKYQFSLKWIRVFYVFGEIQGRKNLFTNLMTAISNKEKLFNMSGGEQIRDFLTPNEISEKIVKISSQTKIQGIINCCSGKPVKLKDFIVNFLEKGNYKIGLNTGYFPYLAYEPMETWGSISKLNLVMKNNLNI